ncbi:hypothetical protein quinque_007248 [Culex quinquefasciatus]
MDPETFLTPRKIFQNAFNAARKSASGSGSPSVFTPTRTNATLLPGPAHQGRQSVRIARAAAHCPMIASLSIFHRPAHSEELAVVPGRGWFGRTAVFEWTIDEVSSLGQANFEPYESQFLQTPDTAREAKAQAAISAYFNEISVPSPVDCPLRNQ